MPGEHVKQSQVCDVVGFRVQGALVADRGAPQGKPTPIGRPTPAAGAGRAAARLDPLLCKL